MISNLVVDPAILLVQ